MKNLLKIWFYLTGIIFLFVILQSFQAVLIPLTIAFTLLPLFLFFLRRWKINASGKGAGKYIVISLLLSASAFPVVLFLVGLGLLASDLLRDFPLIQKNLQIVYEEALKLQEKHALEFISFSPENLQQSFDKISGTFIKLLTSFTLELGTFFFYLILTLMFLFLLIIQRKNLFLAMEDYFRTYFRKSSEELLNDLSETLKDFIIGLLWVRIILFLCIVFVLWIFSVPHLWFWALLGSFFSIIPYIGLIGTGILAGIYTGILTLSFEKFLVIATFFLVFHILESNIITPLIVGKKVNLNSFAVFLALMLGLTVWGVIGMLLSLPVLAALRIVGKHSTYFKPLYILVNDD